MDEKDQKKKQQPTKTEVRSGLRSPETEPMQPGDGLDGVEDILFDVSDEPDAVKSELRDE